MQKEFPGDALIERMKIALCCKNYADVCHALDVKRNVLTQCRKSGKLCGMLEGRLLLHGISPIWVERGLGWKMAHSTEFDNKAYSGENGFISAADANFYSRKRHALQAFREDTFHKEDRLQ